MTRRLKLFTGIAGGAIAIALLVSLLLYRANRPHPLVVLGDYDTEVYGVALSPSNEYLVGWGPVRDKTIGAGEVRVWAALSWNPVSVAKRDLRPVVGVVFTGENTFVTARGLRRERWASDLVTLTDGQDVAEHDLATGRIVGWFENVDCVLTSLRGTHDGRTIIGVGAQYGPDWVFTSGRLITFDAGSRQITSRMTATHAILAVDCDPRGKIVATGDEAGCIQLWDISAEEIVTTFQAHSGPVRSLCYSATGKFLVSGGDDGRVVTWDPNTHREVDVNTFTNKRVLAIAISPDERTIASGDEHGTITRWQALSTHGAESFSGHSSGVTGIVFTIDGNNLVSGGLDGFVKIWRLSE